MTESPEPGQQLCPPRYWDDGTPLYCGLVVLERNPTGPEACPSYGGVGLMVCERCMDAVGDFLEAAYNAKARRKEWEVEGFDSLPLHHLYRGEGIR
jgi:hypothetical protein